MSVENSIEEMLKRAEIEINNLLERLEYLLNVRFPVEEQYNNEICKTFNAITSTQGEKVDVSDNEVNKQIEMYVKKFTELKSQLESMDITEENLLKENVIETSQQTINLLETALNEAKMNFLKEMREKIVIHSEQSKNNILEVEEKRKQEDRIGKEVEALRIKKAYLEGKLSITRLKSKKRKLQEEIENLNNQIETVKNESNEKNNEENNILKFTENKFELKKQPKINDENEEFNNKEENYNEK